MFWHDRKTIPAKDTKIGDVIIATHPTETSTVMGPEYTVIKKHPDRIEVIDNWHNKTEFLDNDLRVDLNLTEDEYHDKYIEDAKAIVYAMNHELYDMGDAYHEMWNGWIETDPYDFAARAKEEKIMVVGWFKLSIQKMDGDLDIGIVAEYEDGERFWCHASSRWFKRWEEDYPELY